MSVWLSKKNTFEGSKIRYSWNNTRSQVMQEPVHLIVRSDSAWTCNRKTQLGKSGHSILFNAVIQGSDNPHSSACCVNVASESSNEARAIAADGES